MRLAAPCRKTSRRATVARRWRIAFKKDIPLGTFGCQRKEVTATGIKITRCVGHRRMGQIKNKVAPDITKKRTFGKRLWKSPERNTVIRNRGLRQQLQLRNEVTDLGGEQPRYVKEADLRKTARLQIAKRVAGFSVCLRHGKDWTLWRGRPPPKRKKTQGTEEEPAK
ncbi:hypothetical protein B7P43_G14406 [Cryptotermes secundus]|uniref:Uncharacterized protein n=1 Tax=Cryptotermes secundus TaxID=105785 RepID=A0A2J7RKK2_9NEOP|nr:hypothetical protein B7P43_G14406 [Cryptotermes secundus]